MEKVACLRGDEPGDLPPVAVVSEKEYLERLASYDTGSADERAADEANYALWNRGLALFGLAPKTYMIADARRDQAAMIAAAYFHDEKDILVIDDGEPLDDEDAVITFAHEIVHALQDRQLHLADYEARFGTDFDASLAVTAIIEGEAVHYQTLLTIELEGHTPDELRWEDYYDGWRADTLIDAEADEAPAALASLRFPYAFGGGYVSQQWLANGRAGIEALFAHPPRTTSEVLFGTEPSKLRAASKALEVHAVPDLPASFDRVDHTPLGAWIARIYAARQNVPAPDRLLAAESLGADELSIQHDPQDDVLVAGWRVRTLDGGSPVSWPIRERPSVITTRESLEPEVSLLGVDPAPLAGADMLSWVSAEQSANQQADASASASGMPIELDQRSQRACAAARGSRLRWR